MLRWLFWWVLGLLKQSTHHYPQKPTPPAAPTYTTQTDFAGRIVAAMRRYGYRIDIGPGVYNIIYIKNVDEHGKPRRDRGRYHYDDLRVILQVFSNGKAGIVAAWDATVDPFISVNSGGAAQIQCPSQQTAWPRVGPAANRRRSHH
jgi:hypothetical protein